MLSLGLYMNFKQAVGSENIYGVFNVFVKKIRVHLQSVGEKNHPHGKFVIFEKFVFNYFSLVSGSGGQDSFYSFNSCSKKHYSHGKSVSIRVQKTFVPPMPVYIASSLINSRMLQIPLNLQQKQ